MVVRDVSGAAGDGVDRSARVDLSVIGPWRVDPDYLRVRPESPTGQWLKSVESDYGLNVGALNAVLAQLDQGWSIRTSLDRAGVPAAGWNVFVEVLYRLAHEGVLVRTALTPSAGTVK